MPESPSSPDSPDYSERPARSGRTASSSSSGATDPEVRGETVASYATYEQPVLPPLDFPELEEVDGVDAANLAAAGDAYYEGMLQRIGSFRAIDELAARFLGGLNIASPDLREAIGDYLRDEPLRRPQSERDPVLALFTDPALERLLLRLSDAVVAFDLSVRPEAIAIGPSFLPQDAARIAFVTAIEDLELFLDAKGGGGVAFVTEEVGKELAAVIRILNDPDLRAHVPGNDVDDLFSVIAGLLPDAQDIPTDWEARQLARKGGFGRRIFQAIAQQIITPPKPGKPLFTDAELNTIGDLVYQWRAAQGSVYAMSADMPAADEQAAVEDGLNVIRLRRRLPA
jgi:hypothetical protein